MSGQRSLTPALYASATKKDAADLQGYDVYQVVLSPGTASPKAVTGESVALFTFRLPANCSGQPPTVLSNDGIPNSQISTATATASSTSSKQAAKIPTTTVKSVLATQPTKTTTAWPMRWIPALASRWLIPTATATVCLTASRPTM
ncbi:MAG: hypothetical protein R2856_10325 [Caldilineaceae bacterium]